MKLGSSLTRNSENKPRKSSSSTSLNGSLSARLSPDNFSEISLEPEDTLKQSDEINSTVPMKLEQSLLNVDETEPIKSSITGPLVADESCKETVPNLKQTVTPTNSHSDAAAVLNTEPLNTTLAGEDGATIPSSAGSPKTQCPQVVDQTHSPCGSTTASSDIDILDHESTFSETSSASKMTEFDNHLHMIGADPNHIRLSHDNFDSEASDIVRISGYCSSPLSMDGYENNIVFKPSEKTERVCHEDTPASSGIEDESSVLFPPIRQDSSTDDNIRDSLSMSSEDETQKDTCDDNMNDSQSSTVHIDNPTTDSMNAATEVLSESDTTKEQSATESVCEDVNKAMDNDGPVLEVPSNVNVQLEDEITQAALSVDESQHEATESPNKVVEVEVDSTATAQQNTAEIETVTVSSDEVNETQKKFEHYEQQLVTLSLNNAKLSEENDNLRSEVNNAKLMSLNSFETEREEFLNTIDSLNVQLQELQFNNEELSENLQSAKTDLSQRLSNEQVQQLISEKEESIQGLLEEGEALSKKHLQQNNLIKKLRSKASEREQAVTSLTEKLSKFEEENKSLKEKLSELKGRSTEDRGTAERLTEAYQEREFRMSELVNQLEDSEEKRRAAQATLDAAYKELAELNKQQVAIESEKEDEIRRHEEAVERRMQQDMERVEQEHEHQIHMLHLQMAELRDAVERTEAIATRKEDQWRKEVQDLQQRLQDSELRNHELSEGITESTRPLLRQMENLQSTHSAQAKTWDALEKSLTSRLVDAQTQLSAAQDRERSAQMTLVDVKSRAVTSERQLSDERKNKAGLLSELEMLRKKTAEFDTVVEKLNRDLEMKEHSHAEVMSKARKDRLTLENQLDMEKVRAEVEKKKFQAQYESLQREKEKLSWMSRSESMTSSNMLNTDAESIGSSDTFNHIDAFDRQLSASGAPSGVYESLRSVASGSSLLENLQAQLKQRDGEIAQLQGEINTLERTRSSMAEEIVRLTNVNEDLEETAEQVADVKVKLQEMKARHDAVLTMYGEKAEEAEELKLDLEDVKAMYRQQIDALLKADMNT
uniref:TATA element modulatory factor n=1 Tax=Phallusia mammillata TaxID=59560 RepID=A0A6F9DUM1_9ASCI|nr:TATA element modulatory factor [Phallusia mammillata]